MNLTRKEKVIYVKEEELNIKNEIHVIELNPSPPYVFPLLENANVKEKMDNINKRIYSFYINNIDQIFNLLLKDKQIKLSDGQRILTSRWNQG